MDKLTIACIISLFILLGPGAASLGFIILIATKLVTLNYMTLFNITNLFTYYLYGLQGVLYIYMCTLSLIGSGYMYWYDMSLYDLKNKLIEFEAESKPLDKNCSEKKPTKLISDSVQSSFDKNMDKLCQYKNISVDKFYQKTGFNANTVLKIKQSYFYLSNNFNNLCDFIYLYLCKFRLMTDNIYGIKSIYLVCDEGLNYVKTIDAIKSIHKMSRNLQTNLKIKKPESKTSVLSEINTGGQNNNQLQFNNDLFGNFGMNDFEQMDKQFKNLSATDKKQMDEMAKQLFGNMNINEMMSMMDGVSGKKTKK